MKKIIELVDEKDIIEEEMAKMRARLSEINSEMVELLINFGATDCFSINWKRIKMNFSKPIKIQEDYQY